MNYSYLYVKVLKMYYQKFLYFKKLQKMHI